MYVHFIYMHKIQFQRLITQVKSKINFTRTPKKPLSLVVFVTMLNSNFLALNQFGGRDVPKKAFNYSYLGGGGNVKIVLSRTFYFQKNSFIN